MREVFLNLLLMILEHWRYLNIELNFLGLDASVADFSFSTGI